MNIITSHEHAVSAIERMLMAMDQDAEPIKPPKSQQQQYWESKADELALKCKISMAVIKVDTDNYQVWPLSRCGRDVLYVSEYLEEVVGK